MTRIASPGQLTALGPARPLSERDFQTQIRGLAQRCRWDLVFHAPSVLTMSERGWPDLVLVRVRDRRLIFAELKAERGRLTERQEEVLEILQAVAQPLAGPLGLSGPIPRVEVFCWRPSDWEAIVNALR